MNQHLHDALTPQLAFQYLLDFAGCPNPPPFELTPKAREEIILTKLGLRNESERRMGS